VVPSSPVDPLAREQLEKDARALCDSGEHEAAATLALRGYGPEVFGFLVAVLRTEADASDAFSETSEVLWRKLPTFAWESTLRTWTYGIARNVARTLRRDGARRERRVGNVSDSRLEAVAQAVRTETQSYLRTDKRTRLQALRDSLPEEDRMLLVLRVDRKLEWTELARVLGGDDAPLDGPELARTAARLRKRFQLVKDRLRELARRQGLVD
jgi:RNA polymerase sigma-70 factor, ECF subfamily